VIVEGILVLAEERLRAQMDLKIFVATDDDVRLMRRIGRDIEQRGRTFAQIRDQYEATVRPMHTAFVEPSKRYADLIFPEGGENRPALDAIVGRLLHTLGRA
jgi:uridine kinase